MWQKSQPYRLKVLKVVILNLISNHASDPTMYLGYYSKDDHYRNSASRYNPAGISGHLIRKVIRGLISMDYIEWHRGRYNVQHRVGYVCKCRATSLLIDVLKIHNAMVTPVRNPHADPIELRAIKFKEYFGEKCVTHGGRSIDYKDTAMTKAMRSNLKAYNDFMADVAIEYKGAVIPFEGVRRVFNGSWTEGGRFYGGFWQGDDGPKRSRIILGGWHVRELDYSSQHMTIAYIHAGLVPGSDLYDIHDIPRKIVKKGSMLLLSAGSQRTVVREVKKVIEKMGRHDLDPKMIAKMIEHKHRAIKAYHYKRMGTKLQYIDSQVCEYVLKVMTKAKIPCLPIHDSFVVPRHWVEYLRSTMVKAFKEIMNTNITPLID